MEGRNFASKNGLKALNLNFRNITTIPHKPSNETLTSPKMGKIFEFRKTANLILIFFHGDSEFQQIKNRKFPGKQKKHKNTHTQQK